MSSLAGNLPHTALLLAAGRGTRLGDMTRVLPKCMAPVKGRTIFERAAKRLTACGIKQLVVVTGHQHDILKTYVRQAATGLDCQFVHSPDYATTNNIVSLWQAREAVEESFLLLESDLIFTDSLLHALKGGTNAAVSPVADWMDGTVLTIDEQHRIEHMYVKGNTLPSRPLYKTINIYTVEAQDWQGIIYPALDRRVQQGDTNIYYEKVFADIIAEGDLQMDVSICDESTWREVDTPEDLKHAEAWLEQDGVLKH